MHAKALFTSCTLVLMLQFAGVAYGAETDIAIAKITKIDGKAFAFADGVRRTLDDGDALYANDKILTSRDTSADIKFTDDTQLSLGESTIINLDSYSYLEKTQNKNDDAEESFTLSILTGTVRAFTGLLAKRRPGRVRFKTKVATIGIRGTHFVAEVAGDSATIILLAQKDADASNAIEVSNAFGKVDIDKAGYGTEIPDANSPPSPPRKMQSTNSMNRTLRSIQTNRRVRIPRSPMR